MRIAIVGSQNAGKSLLINKFLEKWPMYNKANPTYRDFIDKNTPLNQQGTVESQRIIRDALVEQAIKNKDVKHCIHDRCILDNLVYSLWLSDKGKINNSEFILESFNITRETLKLYDIIFFLPISDKNPIVFEKRETRDLDLVYRKEIDSIFSGTLDTYMQQTGLIFPLEDSPAFIPIVGDEMLSEKTNQLELYINENGDPVEANQDFMTDLEEALKTEVWDELEKRQKKKT